MDTLRNILNTKSIISSLFEFHSKGESPKGDVVKTIHSNKINYIEIPQNFVLYRSGGSEESKGSYKPQFVSSWQVAALYSDTKLRNNFISYKFINNINLIIVNDILLTYLITRIDSVSHEQRKIILEFLYVFGYNVNTIFTKLSPEERKGCKNAKEFFHLWASELLEASIIIDTEYATNNKVFYRISTGENDAKVFNSFISISSELLNKQPLGTAPNIEFKGLYIPPISSGMLNLSNIMTVDNMFPEEVFVTHDVITQYTHVPYTMIVKLNVYNSYITHPVSLNDFYTQMSYIAITRIYLYSTIFHHIHEIIYECLHKIVDSVNITNIEDNLGPQNGDKKRKRTTPKKTKLNRTSKRLNNYTTQHTTNFYQIEAKKFIKATQKNLSYILFEASKIIDSALSIDPVLLDTKLIPSKLKNPYYVDKILNDNLLAYTVLGTTIKHSVMGLSHMFSLYNVYDDDESHVPAASHNEYFNVDMIGNASNVPNVDMHRPTAATAYNHTVATAPYHTAATAPYHTAATAYNHTAATAPYHDGSMLEPIITGGALFGIYTHGENRRQTKDIDVKLIDMNDKEEYSNEQALFKDSTYVPHETQLWKFTMINYVWISIIEKIFQETAQTRINIYIKYINDSDGDSSKMKFLKTDENKRWSVYLGSIKTTRVFLKITEFKKCIEQNTNEGQKFIEILNSTLETTPIILTNSITINSIQSYNDTMKQLLANRHTNISTKKQLKELNFNINKKIHQIIGRDDYNKYNTVITTMQRVMNERPLLKLPNDNDYKPGYFISLLILNKATKKESGLLDITFDTYYSSVGSFSKFSGLQKFHHVNLNGSLYGSALWFIKESIYLNTLCNDTMYPGDNDAAMNPENQCSPSRDRRIEKQKKYAERYNKLRIYLIVFLKSLMIKPHFLLEGKDGATQEIPNETRLEELYDYITYFFKTPEDKRQFNIELFKYAQQQSKDSGEYMVGANRKKTRRRAKSIEF